MHILIGILTAIAGVVWALYRLQNSGVDLNSFNPFYWLRRRQWQNKLGTSPLHRIEKPMEAAAVLVVAMIKAEGEISREQKHDVIAMFETEFSLSNADATSVFSSSSFLLQNSLDICTETSHILAPTRPSFTAEQTDSLLALLERASQLDGQASDAQRRLIGAVKSELSNDVPNDGKWS